MLTNNKFYSAADPESGGSPIITPDNCEYYFLLYIDKELNNQEIKAVNYFLEQNPNYQVVFDHLSEAKLATETLKINKAPFYQHTNINVNNYETYFLLAIDNALKKEEKEKLNDFLLENPGLSESYRLLEKTKLPATGHSFNKALLYKTGDPLFRNTTVSEMFSLYIDKETTPAEKNAVELLLTNDKALQHEMDLLQKTKAEPEVMVFPFKKSLYRKEEKKVPVIPIWFRYAAAACVLLAVSFLADRYYFSNTTNPKPDFAKETRIENGLQTDADRKSTFATGKSSGKVIENNSTVNITPEINREKTKSIKNGLYQLPTVKMPLNEKNIVTNKNNKRNILNNVVNKTVLTNKDVAMNNKGKNDADLTLPSGITNMLNQKGELATINTVLKTDLPLNASFIASKEVADNDVSILTMNAEQIDKKGKVKKMKNRLGNFLKQKIDNIANTSISVGRYEIAYAK